MTVLEILESLYPDGAPLSPEDRSRIRTELFGSTPATSPSEPLRRSTLRRTMSVAAALLVGCGAAGIWVAVSRPAEHRGADTPPLTVAEATAVTPATLQLAPFLVDTTTAATAPTATSIVPPTSPPAAASSSQTFFELADAVAATTDIAFDAIDEATQQCMSARGVDDVPTPTYLLLAPHVTPNDFPWNMPNDSPITDGYAKPPDRIFTEVGDPAEGSEAFAALYGEIIGTWATDDPDPVPGSAIAGDVFSGCYPTAQTEVIGGGDPAAAFNLYDTALRLDDARIAIGEAVTADPRYGAAIMDWAACMQGLGINATGPQELLGRNWGRQRPTAEELTTATADADCRTSSKLTVIGNQLLDDAATSWFAANPEAADEISQVVHLVNARVAQLASSPP